MPELNTRIGRHSKKFIEKASSCDWYSELRPTIQVLVSALPGATLAGLDSRPPADRPQLLLGLASAYVEQTRDILRVRVEQQGRLSSVQTPAEATAASAAAAADSSDVVDSASGRPISIPLGESGGNGSGGKTDVVFERLAPELLYTDQK